MIPDARRVPPQRIADVGADAVDVNMQLVLRPAKDRVHEPATGLCKAGGIQ